MISPSYLRIENAEGYVLIAVYLFIYLYACYSRNKKSFKPNRMKFGGMVGFYPGTMITFWDQSGQRSKSRKGQHLLESHEIWWDDWLLSGNHVIRFWDQSGQRSRSCNWHATNAKMFIIQCPLLWYAKVCALPSAHSSLLSFALYKNPHYLFHSFYNIFSTHIALPWL